MSLFTTLDTLGVLLPRRLARVGDEFEGVCRHPSHPTPLNVRGEIETGSPDVFCDGKKVARDGDIVRATCGHTGKIAVVINTPLRVRTNNKLTAREKDSVVDDGPQHWVTGELKGGSPRRLIGN